MRVNPSKGKKGKRKGESFVEGNVRAHDVKPKLRHKEAGKKSREGVGGAKHGA